MAIKRQENKEIIAAAAEKLILRAANGYKTIRKYGNYSRSYFDPGFDSGEMKGYITRKTGVYILEKGMNI